MKYHYSILDSGVYIARSISRKNFQGYNSIAEARSIAKTKSVIDDIVNQYNIKEFKLIIEEYPEDYFGKVVHQEFINLNKST